MGTNEKISKPWAWRYQEEIESKFHGIGNGKYGKVLRMARTPTLEEHYKVVLITGIGIIILGALGFIIMLLVGLFLPSA